MTNEEAAAILERMKNYFLPTSPMLEERREITALDLAISALSKRSASSEQVDHIADDSKMVDQFREVTKKTDFKPGDKFIMELGEERRMFGEFEIKGTDLYVKTSLLEKLTRYEPEKFEIHNDHTDCIWYHYLDDDDDVPNACPSTCSQYRDGWNDAMNYIFCNGKGYQPYERKEK